MLARLGTTPQRLKWIAAALISVIWFVIYLTTVSPTVNFIDSGELIAAANEPGIAHAPGYPLYVLMGYVATHLLWGDVAWRLNVMSAFWGALAVGAFFLLTFELSDYVFQSAKPKSRRGAAGRQANTARGRAQARDKRVKSNVPQARGTAAAQVVQPVSLAEDVVRRNWLFILCAAGAATLLAASASFWSRTAQAKMYSLHFFFVFALFLLALYSRRALERGDQKSAGRLFVAMAALLGLSFTNHLMTLLVVIPLAILLLGGAVTDNFRFYVRRLPWAALAFGIPLLLYLYMPWRSAQDPIMNWGSPSTWGDFWRHITGWQFRPYLLGSLGQNLSQNIKLIWGLSGPDTGYLWGQWSFLTILVLVAGLVGLVLLARANMLVFATTATFAVFTIIFSLFYGISEIEPYVVPLYAMISLWIGLAPASWLSIQAKSGQPMKQAVGGIPTTRLVWGAGVGIAVVGLVSALIVYPTQNYSNNRLAEQFVDNVFAELPKGSILFTDYWDFYSPTYYVQLIKNVRPDLVLVDKSLLRYPFYTQQLKQRYPWLIENSKDIVSTFATEQRKWVNGEPFDQALLNSSYFNLMTSFVERNQADHPAYILSLDQCIPNVPTSCEANQIAPSWTRQPVGLTAKLVAPQATADLPTVPDYKLDGILTNPVSLDATARINTSLYVDAYRKLAAVYGAANQTQKAQELTEKAAAIAAAISAR